MFMPVKTLIRFIYKKPGGVICLPMIPQGPAIIATGRLKA
jgi:hypothetical protein